MLGYLSQPKKGWQNLRETRKFSVSIKSMFYLLRQNASVLRGDKKTLSYIIMYSQSCLYDKICKQTFFFLPSPFKVERRRPYHFYFIDTKNRILKGSKHPAQ